MKGCDSTKVEIVDGQLPTDQLKQEVFRWNLHSWNHLGGMSLNQHNSSSTDTSSITLTNYNIQHTGILYSQLSPRLLNPNLSCIFLGNSPGTGRFLQIRWEPFPKSFPQILQYL